jgi:methionyl aminopeptidase
VSSSKSNLQGGNSTQQPVIEIKSDTELEKLRICGQAAAKVLKKLSEHLRPGISTGQLDDIAFKEISSLGMKPAFLGYRGFPASACISINTELVHGIPRSNRIVKDGDIVTIDLGVLSDGFFGDVAATYGVGWVSKEAGKLMEVTKEALERAIVEVKPGNRLGDVSWAVQDFAERSGYSVVRDYVGHGIGRKLHEEPAVPNFGKPNTGPRLAPGIVIAIEPMINIGDWRVKQLSDGWTVVTEDGKLCAHFEHMVAVTKTGNEVLTRI